MADTVLGTSTAIRPKTRAQQEAYLAELIYELNLSGERIQAGLENINRQMESIVREMREARRGNEAEIQ
jgi:hypothetical protein